MQRFVQRSGSRLARKEGSRMMKQTLGLVVLTVVALFLLVQFGIPAIVNMAVFLGDLKASSTPIGQKDTVAPAPPILDQLPTATISAKLDITGYTEAGVLVSLHKGGVQLAETSADDTGSFTFSNLDLESGENTFFAVAKDTAGNESGQSNRVAVNFDTLPPKLDLTSPREGLELFGESKRMIEVSGDTDAGPEVMVNSYYAVVSSLGTFSNRIRLEEGDNTITVTARDGAGNTTTKTVSVKFSL